MHYRNNYYSNVKLFGEKIFIFTFSEYLDKFLKMYLYFLKLLLQLLKKKIYIYY